MRMRRVDGFSFFFQAEDGIRDYKVTGVQTCALPISPSPTSSTKSLLLLRRHSADAPQSSVARASHRRRDSSRQLPHAALDAGVGLLEIGRASCRERV